jgi:tetratricopeptide (TPR) repeat protein
MGEVYRARDLKLGRDVAIKILPEGFAFEPDRLARFHREAEALALLNHPNIATIHALEEVERVPALVMELVEGPTLAELIASGPLPVERSLQIGRQVADALVAARDKGVIHRDLKPANIKIRPDGTVKVLDFGLAKIGGAEVAQQALSQLPTETLSGTQAGLILGTAAYMSPEQTRGLPVDERTDVWAFGCVLYEMLAGRSAFGGPTLSDTIASILEHEPDWRRLPRPTPRTIRDLLVRCVRKDLQSRLKDIAVARLQIDEAITHLNGQATRERRWKVAAGTAVVLTAMIVTAWIRPWESAPRARKQDVPIQSAIPSTQRRPVTLLIAKFQNLTKDDVFNRSLEIVLRRSLEQAPFIIAFDRDSGVRVLGLDPVEALDEATALEFAAMQGLSAVLTGSIKLSDGGYEISLEAVEPSSRTVLGNATRRAANKERVLLAVLEAAASVRHGLGYQGSDADQSEAMSRLSTTPLDVLSLFVAASEEGANRRFQEALDLASRAVSIAPDFGPGYQMLSVLSRNMDRQTEADRYLDEALRHLNSMTQREQYLVRATDHRRKNDWRQCEKESAELVARFPSDVLGLNLWALCQSMLRDFDGAVKAMRKAVAILPANQLFRLNLSFYASYAGDFRVAEQEARNTRPPGDFTKLALAFSQLGQGQPDEVRRVYGDLASTPGAASRAASGLADLALYEGRFAEAARLLERGAAADLASKSNWRAARKLAWLGHVQLLRGMRGLAIQAAERALMASDSGATRLLAARVFVEADATDRARAEAARISLGTVPETDPPRASGPTFEPEAYAKIIEAEIALKSDPRLAIKLLSEANMLADTWLGHFDLGLAYLKVPAFAQAQAEFDLCIRRRGEVIAMFFDEEPTYGFFPPVLYYQGVARAALKRPDFTESFQAYRQLRGKSTEDRLIREIQKLLTP